MDSWDETFCMLFGPWLVFATVVVLRRRRRDRRLVPDSYARKLATRRALKIVGMPPCLSAAYLLFLSAIFLETLWWGQDSSLKAISSRFKPAICTFVSCALLAWLIFKKAHARKMFQQIASEDWQVCPDCRYSLRGHADGRSSPLSNISLLRCPECSYLFTPESLLRDWADTVTLVNNMVRGTYPDPPHFST